MSENITTAEVTPRGFRYWRIRNRDYSGEPEYVIEVQESSLATEAKVWLGKHGSHRMHLSEAAARAIRDALTELLADQPTEPARCAPSREDVREAIIGCGLTGDIVTAIQALYATQRTEAEVKAEALREVADNAEDALSESENKQWDYDWIVYLRGVADRLAPAQPVPDVPEVGLPTPEVPAFWTSERFTNPYRATQPTPAFEAMGLPTPEVPNVGGCPRCGHAPHGTDFCYYASEADGECECGGEQR